MLLFLNYIRELFIIVITVIPHRVPSPRELAMHTQTIMQNALIKKKLEEQRENFRKRQDQQQQQQQVQQQQVQQQRPSTPVNSPAKQTASPLAFTPTSVLRKMTADKEPDGANQVETSTTAVSVVNGDISQSCMSPNNHQTSKVTLNNSSKLINSVNQVQNEVLKTIFMNSAMSNHMNNDSTFDMEESALKTKYLCPLKQNKNATGDNSDINTTKENVFLDVNENANDDITEKEPDDTDNKNDNNNDDNDNVIDIDIDIDNDTNNNNCVSLDEALRKSFETLIDESNETISMTSDGVGNVDLQSATLVTVNGKDV